MKLVKTISTISIIYSMLFILSCQKENIPANDYSHLEGNFYCEATSSSSYDGRFDDVDYDVVIKLFVENDSIKFYYNNGTTIDFGLKIDSEEQTSFEFIDDDIGYTRYSLIYDDNFNSIELKVSESSPSYNGLRSSSTTFVGEKTTLEETTEKVLDANVGYFLIAATEPDTQYTQAMLIDRDSGNGRYIEIGDKSYNTDYFYEYWNQTTFRSHYGSTYRTVKNVSWTSSNFSYYSKSTNNINNVAVPYTSIRTYSYAGPKQ